MYVCYALPGVYRLAANSYESCSHISSCGILDQPWPLFVPNEPPSTQNLPCVNPKHNPTPFEGAATRFKGALTPYIFIVILQQQRGSGTCAAALAQLQRLASRMERLGPCPMASFDGETESPNKQLLGFRLPQEGL